MDTLLLNADGSPLSMLPVSIISWKDAIKLLMLEKIRTIKDHDEWVVRSPSITMPVPSIVMMTEYVKWPRNVKFSRYNLFLRDDFTCQLQITSRCSRNEGMGHSYNELTLDHVNPRSKGGGFSWCNIVTACGTCNSQKGNNKIKIKKVPKTPTYYELVDKRRKAPITIKDLAWQDYLMWNEDLVYYRPHKGKKVKLTNTVINIGDIHND